MTTVVLLQNHKIQRAFIIMSDKSRKNRLTFCHTFLFNSHTYTHTYKNKCMHTYIPYVDYADKLVQFNK